MLAPARHDLESAVDRIDALKVFPVAAVRIVRVSRDPEATIADMEAAVAADPVLAAKVLAVANSPLAGLRSRVTTLGRAVSVLGLVGTRDVTLTALVGCVASAPAPWGPLLHRHALLAAQLSRLLAREVRGVDPSEAFVTGLLHDLGQQLLLMVEPEATTTLLDRFHRRPLLLERAEQLHFGFDHAALSARCVRHWELPDEIAQVVAAHHEPPVVGEVSLPAVVLAVADDLAHAWADGARPHGLRQVFEDHAVSRLLGIDPGRLLRRLVDAQEVLAAL